MGTRPGAVPHPVAQKRRQGWGTPRTLWFNNKRLGHPPRAFHFEIRLVFAILTVRGCVMADKSTLIVLTVKSIQKEPYVSPGGGMCRSATIKAVSSNPELIFEMRTSLLNSEQVRRCELL